VRFLSDRPRERHDARYSWATTAKEWDSSLRSSGLGVAMVAAIISRNFRRELLSSF
jgi:hypothetical protein